jgi:glutamate-1-semialdehyde 2,1-aminomutase
MIKRAKSQELFDKAKKLFPGGVNSPVRAFKSVYGPPVFIKNGNGCKFYDEDDNEFIDFCCSWGPLIHGHNNPVIKKAVIETIENGMSFGTPTKHGNKLGELIINNHRFIDKIRFVSSGTEAVMSAIRLARGYTGKDKIVKFNGCYHGHVDSLLVNAGSGLVTFGVSSSAGIPEAFAKETIVVDLNDLQGFENILREYSHEIAAVIIEPIPANNGLLLQDNNYLAWLRKLCDEYGVLLIFDEVISGFRVGFEGASGYYSIEPDIITFGKIIGGGLPVGAFGGKDEIMSILSPDGPVYQAGTLSANPVAMTAGLKSLELCLEEGFYEKLEIKTKFFTDIIRDHIKAKGYPMRIETIGSIFWISFSEKRIINSDDIDPKKMELFKSLHQFLLDHGIYLGPSGYEVGFISSAHDSTSLRIAAETINNSIDQLFA